MSDLLSSRLTALWDSINNGNTIAIDSFWTEIEQHGAPLIEPATEGYCNVTFLWRVVNTAVDTISAASKIHFSTR